MLKELIVANLKKETAVKSPQNFRLNPSTMLKCRRAIWYQYHIPPSDEVTDANLVKMAMGDSVHLFVQKLLNDLELENVLKVVDIETDKVVRLEGADFDIAYRIDAVVEMLNTQKKYVVEIKSTYSQGFDRVAMEADENHLSQLRFYMVLENIPDGILIYISRDKGLIVEHMIQMNAEEMAQCKKEIIKRGSELHRLVLGSNLPPRDFNLVVKDTSKGLDFSASDWQCRYCVYRSVCYENKSKK